MSAPTPIARGHERTIERLAAAARDLSERGVHTLAHATIFAGPAGVGKFRVATWWASRLKCSGTSTGCESDGTAAMGGESARCRDCAQIAARTHADVTVLEPDAENGSIKIESVRNLIRAMALRPLRPGPRIAIIRDAQELTPHAQSAMLKLLEEPPGFAVLVLITHNLSALLPTLRSRCSAVRFGPLADEEVRGALEAAGRAQAEARSAAALAGGSVGHALGLTGEAIADRDDVIAAYEDLRSGASEDVEKLVAELADRRKSERPALAALLEWQMRKVEASLGYPALETSERIARLLADAAREDSQGLLDEAMRTLSAIDALERNANPRLVLRELLLDVRPA